MEIKKYSRIEGLFGLTLVIIFISKSLFNILFGIIFLTSI